MIKKWLMSCLVWACCASGAWANSSPLLFELSHQDAASAIAALLVERGAGEHVQVTINGNAQEPLFRHTSALTAQMTGLTLNKATRSWSGNLLFMSGDEVVSAKAIAGRYQEVVSVPVLRRRVDSGAVISEQDIEIQMHPVDRLRSDVISDASALIGRSPIRTISPLRPIRTHEIISPAVVKKNTMVKMTYQTGGLSISTTAIAMEDGAAGDIIAVRNAASKKVIQASVQDSGTVVVASAPPVATAAAQIPAPAAHAAQIQDILPVSSPVEIHHALN